MAAYSIDIPIPRSIKLRSSLAKKQWFRNLEGDVDPEDDFVNTGASDCNTIASAFSTSPYNVYENQRSPQGKLFILLPLEVWSHSLLA